MPDVLSQVQQDISLKKHNTFGIDATASHFLSVESPDQLEKLPVHGWPQILVLGGGSNVLFTKDFDGLLLYNNLLGKRIIAEDDTAVIVEARSGENWHDFVTWTLGKGYFGLENLSLIPGTVGAAPIQNIGAYGVEQVDHFNGLLAFDLYDKRFRYFDEKACSFGYRDSFFKGEGKGRYFILSVQFRLSKIPAINTGYGAIKAHLHQQGIALPTPLDVSEAVISIRKTKLPDPKEIGNAGSFFKNPVISKTQYLKIKQEYPDIVHYDLPDGRIKIPAAWLIDRAGWKGKRVGNTGCHKNQALVLVNYGQATGKEILDLAHSIQKDIQSKFNIDLHREVSVV